MNAPMDAAVATADEHDVLLAADGCLWIRLVDGETWVYVTDDGEGGLELGYDVRDRLPVEYEPYQALDAAAEMLVLAGLRARGL